MELQCIVVPAYSLSNGECVFVIFSLMSACIIIKKIRDSAELVFTIFQY